MLFINDLVPFFAKDLNGCMRWTSYFSIEMKLFLTLPIVVYYFHLGYQKLTTAICLIMVTLGFTIYGCSLYFYRIHPGYLNLFDY